MLVVQYIQIIGIVMKQDIYGKNNMVMKIVMELQLQIKHYVIQMMLVVLVVVMVMYHVNMYYLDIMKIAIELKVIIQKLGILQIIVMQFQ